LIKDSINMRRRISTDSAIDTSVQHLAAHGPATPDNSQSTSECGCCQGMWKLLFGRKQVHILTPSSGATDEFVRLDSEITPMPLNSNYNPSSSTTTHSPTDQETGAVELTSVPQRSASISNDVVPQRKVSTGSDSMDLAVPAMFVSTRRGKARPVAIHGKLEGVGASALSEY
jgi:hypothetical protein